MREDDADEEDESDIDVDLDSMDELDDASTTAEDEEDFESTRDCIPVFLGTSNLLFTYLTIGYAKNQ